MKNFHITYYQPGQTDREFTEVLPFPGETIARSEIRKLGFEIKDIYEVAREKSGLEKLQDYFFKNFSTKTYDVETELAFLRAFQTALSDGFSETEALERARDTFMPSEKRIRWVINDMIETSKGQGISTVYDLFKAHEELFSPDFLTLIKSCMKTKTSIVKVISNPVETKNKGREVEGYVELTESRHLLKTQIWDAVSGPMLYTVGLLSATFTILGFWVPKLFGMLKKFRPKIESDDFTLAGNFTLASSRFITDYGPYIALGILMVAWIGFFLYKTNEEMRRSMESMLLRSPIVGDILTVFYTKKLVSVFAIFLESWMSMDEALYAISAMTPFLPMKEEIEFIAKDIADDQFVDIFNRYGDDGKYFTQTFYKSFALEGRQGRYSRACAYTLKNADDIWNTKLNKIPKKIGARIKTGGLFICAGYIAGTMLIVSLSVANGV